MGRSGHRLLPHTADLIVSAWAPTVPECLAEAVSALVESFADVSGAAPEWTAPFTCPPGPDVELLVSVLDEVIYLLDVHDAVPVRAVLAEAPDGGLVGGFDVVGRSAVRPAGPVPKAVTRHGLRIEHRSGLWRCTAIIDV